MLVGKIVDIKPNEKTLIPASILYIDFGSEIGIKTSSAQLTVNYQQAELLDKHVVCVVNFAPKRVAGVKSEILVLGVTSEPIGIKLLCVDTAVELGSKIA